MRTALCVALLFAGSAAAQSFLTVDGKRDAGPLETAARSSAVFPVDFDADGRVDLLVAGEYGSMWIRRPALRRGLGAGRFEPVPASRYGGWFPAFAAADLDGDGLVEVAGEYGILQIARDGSIALAVPGLGGGPTAFGDVDGDGDLDVVGGGLSLHLQVGPLTFVASNGLAGAAARALDLGDFDGDGDLDLLVARERARDGLYRNDGNGTFADASALLPDVTTTTVACALRDLDGDGVCDVLLLGEGGAGATLLLQRGGALVDASVRLPVPVGDHIGMALGDVDHDGDLDLAVASERGGTILRCVGSGWFVAVPGAWPTPRPNGGIALCDIDADGDLDLVEAGTTSHDRVHFNDGHGNFAGPSGAAQLLPWSGATDHRWLRSVDLDRDGDLDLLGPGTWWDNDGFGRFVARPSAAPAAALATAVAIGDVDGDRRVDVVAPTAFDRFRVVFGDDRGGFGRGVEYQAPIAPSGPASQHQTIAVLHLADLDGDGDLDLLCGAAPSSWMPPPAFARDSLWWNDGTGVFVEDPGWCPGGGAFGKDVAVGDLDGDGRLDFTDGSSTFVQRPDHTFVAVPPDPAGWLWAGNRGRIALADLDGDGALDVVEANACLGTPYCEGVPDVVGWNDGTGRLLRVALTTDHETHDVAVLDVDGDGDLDLFFARTDNGAHGSPADEVWINEGGRTFRQAVADVEVSEVWLDSWAVVGGDFDGDGDADLVTLDSAGWSTDPRAVTWSGLTRHLRAPDLLRIGQPYPLELHGIVRGGVIVGAPQIAHVPLPPLGVLGLHPASTVVIATFGAAPGGRRADVELAVPAVPALAGAVYAFQGAVFDATSTLHLTNRVVETFRPH